ncbi:MAG: hypothetical protein GY851_27100 [bacterium]|nr:hypothetical protein [bacterium]
MSKSLIRIAFLAVVAVAFWWTAGAAAQDATQKRLVKQGKMVLETSMETQPILFGDRKLLLIYHHLGRRLAPPYVHEDWPRHNYLYFKDLDTGKRTKGFASGYGFPSAIVRDGVMNVFTTLDSKDNWTQDVYRFWSTDLTEWQHELVVVRDGDEHLFNTSVCQDETGYVMTYESNKPQQWCWKFARSADLSRWEKLDGLVFLGYPEHPNAGNPIIRYAKPYYYAIFGYGPVPNHYGWLTGIARSKDLETWQMSPMNPILEAPEGGDEGRNNTDADIAEFDGKTHIFYATGDQSTWGEVREAIYPGTLREYFESCFPEGADMVEFSAKQGDRGTRPAAPTASGHVGGPAPSPAAKWESIVQLPEGVTTMDDGTADCIEYARPSANQLACQTRQLGAFCHFGLTTGAETDEEYNKVFAHIPGLPDASTFNPVDLDAEQWVLTAKAFGAKWFVFTTKHHDGFCLWPTETTDYCIRNTPWKEGKGDIVAEVVAACRKHDMPLGLYCSPADGMFDCFCTPDRKLHGDVEAYFAIYCRQLRELLTTYGGDLCEVWLDGYLDPFGEDVIDPKTGKPVGPGYANAIRALVQELEPNAVIIQRTSQGGDIRWTGNEEGYADYPLWNIIRPGEGADHWLSEAASGWFIPEANIHPRPHWLWRPGSDAHYASLDRLLASYYASIGNGANLLINLTPDTQGVIPDLEVDRLTQLGNEVAQRLGTPLATAASANGWAQPGILEIPLQAPCILDHVVTEEDLAKGQHVLEYAIDVYHQGQWTVAALGESVGRKHIQRLDPPVPAEGARLRIVRANAIPSIQAVACYGKAE